MSHKDASKSAIKFLQINLRHGRLAVASFAQTILELDIDVALVQEPYASRTTAHSPLIIPYLPDSYEALHLLGDDHHFGAAIVAKKSLRCRLLPNRSANHVAAALVELDGASILLLSIYLRPSLPSLEAELLPILAGLSSYMNRAIIGVDANAKNPLWNSNGLNQRGRELESLLARFPINVANAPVASLPFTPPETNFIDITLVGHSIPILNWHYPDIPTLSDHPFIYFERACPSARSVVPVRCFNFLPQVDKLFKEKFLGLLHSAIAKRKPSPSTPAMLTPASIDDAVHVLVELISVSARKSRRPKPPLTATGRMPWWSENLNRLRRETRSSRKKWIACDSSEKMRYRLSYQRAKSEYQRALRLAIEKEWLDFCARVSDAELLEALKRLSCCQSPSSLPPQILVDGRSFSEPIKILQQFAGHFFPPPIPQEDATTSDTNREASQAQADVTPFSPTELAGTHSAINRGIRTVAADFLPILPNELADAMASLSPSASPGPDGISAELLHLSAHIISPVLLTIMNNALRCSYFPVQWRHAKVKIIPKLGKADYSLTSSFRPISLVSTLSKVFEKILLARLSWIANSKNWFSDRQHGFREGKSTETAAHQLVSFIETGFSKGLSTATAFIDIQSAFDRASHHAILAALVRKECPDYLVHIIASFLNNRRATLFNETCSFSVDLHTGCPQGSVLSAFLWLVLVNDVLEIPFDFAYLNLAYADDITLAAAHRDPETATANLQKICAEVGKWSSSVDLTINARKTTFMLFSRKRNIPQISLQLEGQTIQPVRQFSYLGFLLEQRLSWLPHVQAKCLSAKKLIFAARRYLVNTWGLSMLRLKKVYVSAIEPMLLYGCSLWCPAIDRARPLAALRSIQRLLAVIILRTFKSTSAEACLALSGLLPIELRFPELAASRFLSIS